MSEYDFVVIGGGSAGFAGASLAGNLGLKTALIEGADEVGGLCILRGCMPSKTIIESANRFHTLRRAQEFGLRADNISADARQIIERKRRLVAEFAHHRREQLASGPFDFVRGRARFVGAHTVEVAGENGPARINGKAFLLATGSVVNHIPIPGLEAVGYLDSDAVLEWAELPESVLVLGAGATGLEFAHYFASLGTNVTVLQRGGQVLKEMDEDVASALGGALEKHGMKILYNTKLLGAERAGDKKRVYFEHEGSEKFVEVTEIIYALGRKPMLAGLDLENAGIALNNGRLKVRPTQQTDQPHVFAAGDCSGPFEIVHIALQQAELAARNAARLIHFKRGQLDEIDYRIKLFVVFTKPQVASIGMSEKELQSAGTRHLAARHSFHDHGKSLVIGETDGFVKLLAAEKSGEILGASIVGPGAAELIHEMAVAMHFRATAQDIVHTPHYHPTLSEIWLYPAEELAVACSRNHSIDTAPAVIQ
jgi:pyruvate/2-oxoglutarate dehydrogenase complex dihydrolipoamide dehydrogenase (E3) component